VGENASGLRDAEHDRQGQGLSTGFGPTCRRYPNDERTPQQFENDFFPGWDVSKKYASPATLKWQEKFIAANKKVIEEAKRRVHG
jgi:hypothetical protein